MPVKIQQTSGQGRTYDAFLDKISFQDQRRASSRVHVSSKCILTSVVQSAGDEDAKVQKCASAAGDRKQVSREDEHSYKPHTPKLFLVFILHCTYLVCQYVTTMRPQETVRQTKEEVSNTSYYTNVYTPDPKTLRCITRTPVPDFDRHCGRDISSPEVMGFSPRDPFPLDRYMEPEYIGLVRPSWPCHGRSSYAPETRLAYGGVRALRAD